MTALLGGLARQAALRRAKCKLLLSAADFVLDTVVSYSLTPGGNTKRAIGIKPLANMTFEELKGELLTGLISLFPELRVVAAQPQALIAGTRDL